MKWTLVASVACLVLAGTTVVAQSPTISQVFAFYCNDSYSSCPYGMDPTLKPIQLSNGNFYGVTWWAGQGSSSAGGTVWEVTPAGKASVVHTFEPNKQGEFPNGENPVIAFAAGADGNLYGITESGGSANQGVFYKQPPTDKGFKVELNLCTGSCTAIQGPVILGNDGNFYGIEDEGGEIFKLTPTGTLSTLYTLGSGDGWAETLLQGSDGNFYGTGVIGTPCDRQATVFKLTPSGQFTILYTFAAFSEIGGNLVQASDGNFYGAVENGQTTIFRITPTGSVTMLYSLQQGEGSEVVGLLQGSDGNLWGLTADGGPQPARPGAVFAVSLQGASIGTAAFNCDTVGCMPMGMVQGSDGNLYGIAISGGSAPGRVPMGTLFKVNPNGL